MPSRMTQATALVLQALAGGRSYGFDIMDATGLRSGTVFPILRRLEAAGLLQGAWESEVEAHAEGRPARRFYRLTGAGESALPGAVARLDRTRRTLDALLPAEGG